MRIQTILIAFVAMFFAACSSDVRVKTASMGLDSNYLVTYWEGSCGGVGGGCSRGETRVKVCKINSDNTVACEHSGDAEKALNPHKD